jgi:hypothetical protein
MERIMTNPELLIAQRVLLAMRLGQTLHVEPGHASFLLPADIPKLKVLRCHYIRSTPHQSPLLL